jgi:RNA polymerase sigma-70 factor (ECF subfamily)
MSADHAAFERLLAGIQAGDQDALDELVRLYEFEVRTAARALLGPGLRPYLDSIDLAQSVHFVLLEGIQHQKLTIGSPEHLVAMAVTVVHRKVARHWRHLQKQKRLDGWTGDERDLAAVLGSLTGRDDNPADEVQRQDEIEHLLRDLDPHDRQLLELKLQGLSTVEAASAMNADADVLRVRLSRLRKQLVARHLKTDWL